MLLFCACIRSPWGLGGSGRFIWVLQIISHTDSTALESGGEDVIWPQLRSFLPVCIGPGPGHRLWQCWCSFVCHLYSKILLHWKRLWFVWCKYASFIHLSNSQITSLSDQCCLVYFPVASAEFQFVLMLPWYPVFLAAEYRVCLIPVRSKSLYVLLWVRNFSRSNQLNSMLPWYPLAEFRVCWIPVMCLVSWCEFVTL